MSYTFRPAIREQTPLIIGIAGATKSGKTMSALRLATGVAHGGTIAMINAEGLRGHQYAEKFKYITCDLSAPFRPAHYTDALEAAAELKPAVIIIDSVSHMHDGPGGILEWHEEILDQISKDDKGKRDRSNFTAWIKPKAAENQFIYKLLSVKCPIILCMRAKEKIKVVPGKPPIDLGWQPIVGERVAFETMFTLMLTPHCKGVPDLSLSDMREPFDTLISGKDQLNESLGEKLAKWAEGQQGESLALGKALQQLAENPGYHNESTVTPPAPSVFDESSAVAEHELALDEATTESEAQQAWNDITKDGRLTTASRGPLYQKYQRKAKELKAKK
jgi:hypothetical protein